MTAAVSCLVTFLTNLRWPSSIAVALDWAALDIDDLSDERDDVAEDCSELRGISIVM